jgi:hypothetical protein
MEYTAPSILATNDASVAIQQGDDPTNKPGGVIDLVNGLSPNPAYEADE